MALEYARLVYNGFWYTPLREALDAFIDRTQQTVTGEVRLRLYRGSVEVAGRTSPYSLYAKDLASFTMGDSYDQKDARGFINLIGLPIEARAVLESGIAAQPGGTTVNSSSPTSGHEKNTREPVSAVGRTV